MDGALQKECLLIRYKNRYIIRFICETTKPMQEFISFLGQHLYLTVSVGITIFLLLIIEVWRARKTMTGISPQAAISLINHEHAVIIDIRDPDVYKKGHIVHAQNIKAESLVDKKIEKLKNKPLIIVCAAGVSAQRVAADLAKRGLKVYTLQGGMNAWREAKLPIVKESHHG